MSPEPTMRERILIAARGELARTGPVALSMRSIARKVGVTVGALYRYFADRDAVLTELIVEAYDAIGATAERAAAGDGAPAERWVRAWREVRAWALAHPQEFALVYGTPVIGYAAPERTIESAGRLVLALLPLLLDDGNAVPASRAASAFAPGHADDHARARAWAVARLGTAAEDAAVTDARILRFLRAWTELIGAIGFELHGHYVGSLEHGDEFFAHIAAATAESLALRA